MTDFFLSFNWAKLFTMSEKFVFRVISCSEHINTREFNFSSQRVDLLAFFTLANTENPLSAVQFVTGSVRKILIATSRLGKVVVKWLFLMYL